MTRDEARKHLEDGGMLTYEVWTFTNSSMHCDSEEVCCYDSFESVEEVLDTIMFYTSSWDDVKVLK